MARIAEAGRFHTRSVPIRVEGLALLAMAGLLTGCSKTEPVTGFFGYAWGTPFDSVLADSARIAARLSEAGFSLEREPGRLRFRHVQFGMGYGDVRLDFDSGRGLWHGAVRVPADDEEADSIRAAWRGRHGRESQEGQIDTDSGYTTFWWSGSTVDRHYYAPGPTPSGFDSIQILDLFYGGCIDGCPLYSVRLRPDGRAFFHGLRDIVPLGGYAGLWAPDGWDRLSAAASDPAFLTVEPNYRRSNQRGLASRGLSVLYANGERVTAESIEHSGPPAMESLLSVLDSVGAAIAWDQPLVLWDTLDLAAFRWIDLDSLERLAAR